jgi:hypothetical protein
MSLPHATGDLSTNVCPKCKETSEQVLNMQTQKRVGWYCLKCYYFEEAILRETVIPKVTKQPTIKAGGGE